MQSWPERDTSLQRRFFLISFGIIFIFAVGVAATLATVQYREMLLSLENKGKASGVYIAEICKDAMLLKDRLQLDALVAEAHHDEDFLYTVIEDDSGTPLTTAIASLNTANRLVRDSVVKLPRDSSMTDIMAAIGSSRYFIELSHKIVLDASVLGTVRIGVSKQHIYRHLSYHLVIVIMGMVVMALALAIALNVAANRLVMHPVHELAHASDRLAAGDLSTRITISSVGEMKMLVDRFNRMAEQLDTTTVSKTYLDNIFNSITETLIILTPERIIKDVNSASRALLGYDREELTGQPVAMILDESLLAFQAALSGQDFPGFSETVVRSKDGRTIPVLLSSALILTAHGTVEGFVCVVRDMSDIKQAQQVLAFQAQELARSNDELNKFAYIASHDLQEPLRKVTAFGDRLREKYGDILGEQGLDYLSRMQNAARRMQVLISDLLAFSRVTTKGQPFVPVDLGQVAREVVGDLEIKIEQTAATLTLGELPVIDADPLQMRQLFQNLIGNALKFQKTDTPPQIAVTSCPVADQEPGSYGGEQIQLSFKDNGIGFDEKYLDRIFEVFQRLHGRTEYEGTGVGLAICRKIVERHAGSIVARSAPGQGAEFIIQLPCKQTKGESAYGTATWTDDNHSDCR